MDESRFTLDDPKTTRKVALHVLLHLEVFTGLLLGAQDRIILTNINKRIDKLALVNCGLYFHRLISEDSIAFAFSAFTGQDEDIL